MRLLFALALVGIAAVSGATSVFLVLQLSGLMG